MTIAITGATGQLGRLVIEELRRRETPDVVALARTPSKASDLGVPVREADYEKPPTLESALQGVDTLLLISGSEVGKRGPQHRNVIEAAKKAGVGHIVYTSLLHADSSPLSLAIEHRETEKDLTESGVPFTLLRNGWYIENHTASLGAALAQGAIYGAAGEGRFSAAARRDYAAAAAVVLTSEGHAGKTYELSGDEAFTMTEFAAEVSRQSGKEIVYTNLPEADYAGALVEAAGLPAGLAAAIASWDVGASQGALHDEGKTLSQLIGRPTTPMADVVAAAL